MSSSARWEKARQAAHVLYHYTFTTKTIEDGTLWNAGAAKEVPPVSKGEVLFAFEWPDRLRIEGSRT
jgi:hypothetical protein